MIAKHTEMLIYRKDSRYHRILVYEEGFVRTLRSALGSSARKQSSIHVKDLSRHLLEYTRLIFAGLLLNENPQKVLIIGLGGGEHFPTRLVIVNGPPTRVVPVKAVKDGGHQITILTLTIGCFGSW